MNNNHFADDSFAVWVVPNKENESFCDLDVHINHWIMPDKETGVRAYLDFGIRAYLANNVRQICVYIPFDVNESNYTDLSMLLQNKDTACGIFNTPCSINYEDETGLIELIYDNHESNVIKLDKQINPIYNGCIILFDVSSVVSKLTKKEIYIRFRIRNDTLEKLLKEEIRYLQSFTSVLSNPIIKGNYSYTVRINEIRCLPDEIRRNIQRQRIRQIVHVVCRNGELIIDCSRCYKVRLLEKNLFDKYIPSGFQSDNCLTYQWLQENSNGKNYNFTTTFHKEYINKKSMLTYAFFVVLLSAFGGLIVEGIKLLLKPYGIFK